MATLDRSLFWANVGPQKGPYVSMNPRRYGQTWTPDEARELARYLEELADEAERMAAREREEELT